MREVTLCCDITSADAPSLKCRRHTRETVSPKPHAFAARQREAVSTLRDLLYVLLANHCRDQDAL